MNSKENRSEPRNFLAYLRHTNRTNNHHTNFIELGEIMSEKYTEILFKQAQDLAVLNYKAKVAAILAEEIASLVGKRKYAEAQQLVWAMNRVTDA